MHKKVFLSNLPLSELMKVAIETRLYFLNFSPISEKNWAYFKVLIGFTQKNDYKKNPIQDSIYSYYN